MSSDVSDRKVDVSTFPHDGECSGADLHYMRVFGGKDYWSCRGCFGRGVKRGLRYVEPGTSQEDST